MSQNYFANTSLTSGERIRNVQLVKSGGYSGLSGHVQHALSRRTKPTETELTHEKNEMLKISGNNTEIIDTSCCMYPGFKTNTNTTDTWKVRTIGVGSMFKHIIYIDQGEKCCK